jgi:hypothetical protein
MSAVSKIVSQIGNTDLSSSQSKILSEAKANGVDEKQLASMKAQMQMDNLSQMTALFSNLLKKLAESTQGIIQNIR